MASGSDYLHYDNPPPPNYRLVEHAIDINGLDLTASNITIYGVPRNLRKLNKEAYTPQWICIGPLQFDHPKLPPFQMQKATYFESFWIRIMSEHKTDEALMSYIKFLKDNRKNLLHCYAMEFRRSIFSKEQFLDMLLLDSVFIMELFLRTHENKSSVKYEDDNILKQTWLSKSIQRDLVLLENQIPFSTLNKLYETVVPQKYKKHSTFIGLANEYFECFRPDKLQDSSDKKNNIQPPAHFTDLIRNFYLFDRESEKKDCDQKKKEFEKEDAPLRSATKLQQAGVSFVKEDDEHLLDLKFEKHRFLSWFPCLGCIPRFTMFEARFQIPQLRINHTTECVLRNIMALEQCHYADKPYVCNYVSLFDSLIRTKEDINLLMEKEIIVHTLGSDMEVETLVHGLCKNVVTNDETCYRDMINELDGYYKRMGWNRNMATLRLVYFRDLWRASSTIIGVVVFMFTVLNFYQAIRGFHVVKN